MVLSTLAQIKTKARRLTASPSINQLSEADLEQYIDAYYEQDFPAEFKLQSLRSSYVFFTKPNEDQYALDTDVNFNVTPPAYIDNNEAFFSQSEQAFYRMYPRSIVEFTGSTGDGLIAGPYSFTLSPVPVLKRNVNLSVVDVTGNTLTCYDKPDPSNNVLGTWIDADSGLALAGSINYVTGAITITWTNTIPTTSSIKARFSPYTASRPNSMLFYQNNFILRPVPDKAYRVSIESYTRPSILLSSDSLSPDIKQWWQLIAVGAAVKILEDRQDIESIQNIMPLLQKQEALAVYRSATQQAPDRTSTIYEDDTNYGGSTFYNSGGA